MKISITHFILFNVLFSSDLIGRYRRTDNDHAYDRTFGTDNEAVNADDNGHHVKVKYNNNNKKN